MKFTATLGDFQKILNKVLPAMPRKSTVPVLEHFHFSLSGSTLKIIATDQEIVIMAQQEVTGIEDGSVLVPGKKITDIVKALGDKGEFEFISDSLNYDINLTTQLGNYNMKGIDPDEYLSLPELFESEKPSIETINAEGDEKSNAKLEKDVIVKLADKTSFAVSTDEYRPAMCGVLFQFRGDFVSSVSTDSFRLSKVTYRNPENNYPIDLDIIIPTRAIEILKKVDDDVIMSTIENNKKITHLRFDIGEIVIITRVIDEKFPPYESVIPHDSGMNCTVLHKDFVSSIKRIDLFANTKTHQIRVEFDKSTITIKAEDEDSGYKGIETITCDYNGTPMTIGFNCKYLEELFDAIDSDKDGNVVFMLTEQNRPVVIRPTAEDQDLLMLIMPVRL
jgi:DNA polymerase III subunit beta